MFGLIGKKIGMTQIFDENGKVIPVTVIQAGPCKVICKRTKEENGYEALQLGFEEKKAKHTSKPLQGHFKKNNCPNYRYVSEFKPAFGQELTEYQVGDELKADIFSEQEYVSVSGVSKGRGYTGVVKRHGFAGFEQSHGVHESYRGPGSIGQCAQPSRVFKGIKMAGQHGNARITVKHLRVVKVDAEQGLILIGGAVPGHRNSLVYIRKEQ
ncbi:MAG: 50S ribosomal protein L3 [Candidatus Cloacimonetes bacterium]|nr:50S ribosomal protein L3 [Candidatus Cloacimonadota bacterium]